jgi:hypothetical protein
MEEEETAAIMLLRDIKGLFEETDWIKIHSSILVEKLITLEERPWSEWKKGKPMTQNSLSKILKTFSIYSKDIRAGVPEKVARGFELDQFEDAFTRYIPNPLIQSATMLQASSHMGCKGFEGATNSQLVALSKGMKATNNGACSTVVLQNTLSEEVTNDAGVF